MSKYTIYVSNNGSDSNDGSLSFPYLTIAKAISVLQNNTTIYLEKGSSFGGEVITLSNKNNIQIDSYGSGNKPLIGGLKSVSGFTNEGGNIWSKQDNDFPDEVTNLFINGSRCINGRVANRTATGGGFGYIDDTGRTEADGYFDGAEIVYWPWDWTRGIARVTSYVSKRFNYDQGWYYYNGKACTYWIQNHRNCLSVQNTWAFNKITKTLYIYSTNEPSNVTVSYGSNAIYADGARYISIKNIEINAACVCGINMKNSYFVEVDTVDFYYSGIYSMCFQYTKNLSIKNCSGYYQNNDFIYISYSTNVLIENNIGLYCGTDQGSQRYLPEIANGGTCGLTIMTSKNITIRYNEIGYTAYTAIGLNYIDKFIVEYNYVHHFNLNKYDGGGIYVVTSGRHFNQFLTNYPVTKGTIRNCIVKDGNSSQNSYGIYLDNNSQEFIIENNFVAGCKYNFHLHDVGFILVSNNISVAEGSCLAAIYTAIQSPWDLRNIITNNYCYSKLNSCPAHYITSSTLPQTIKNNNYLYPHGKAIGGTSGKMQRISNTYYTLAEWIADESRVVYERTNEIELTPSVFDTGLVATTDWIVYFTNPSNVNIEINESDFPYDDYVDYNGNSLSYPITILPYTAQVFIRAPKPEFSYAEYTGNTITIYMTIVLDDTIIPNPSVFTNGINTCSNVAIADNVITLTMQENVSEMGIIYTKPATNPLTSKYANREVDSFSDTMDLFTLTLTSQGDGTGSAYIAFQASSDIIMTLDGNGYFVDNYAGDNPVQTKTILAGLGDTRRDFYVKCTSGVSNLKFDKVKKLTRISNYVTPNANCPSLGGDITKANLLTWLIVPGYNSISGSIEKTTFLTQVTSAYNNTINGNINNHSQLSLFVGNMPITITSAIRMKKIVNLYLSGVVLSSTVVNQILADFVANKDEWKTTEIATTRQLYLYGASGSQAPTGQGLIDKTTLQAYRSPLNDATKKLWTVTTR